MHSLSDRSQVCKFVFMINEAELLADFVVLSEVDRDQLDVEEM